MKLEGNGQSFDQAVIPHFLRFRSPSHCSVGAAPFPSFAWCSSVCELCIASFRCTRMYFNFMLTVTSERCFVDDSCCFACRPFIQAASTSSLADLSQVNYPQRLFSDAGSVVDILRGRSQVETVVNERDAIREQAAKLGDEKEMLIRESEESNRHVERLHEGKFKLVSLCFVFHEQVTDLPLVVILYVHRFSDSSRYRARNGDRHSRQCDQWFDYRPEVFRQSPNWRLVQNQRRS